MKICDRCGPQRAQKAEDLMIIEAEGQEIDLCKECLYAVMEFATTIPKRKNKAPKKGIFSQVGKIIN